MEITLDIGKNIVHEIDELSKKENIELDVLVLKIIDLGLRVYVSAKNADEKDEIDPVLEDIFKNCLETNSLVKEIIGHVFVKERSTLRAYDHYAAINVYENMAKSFIQGKKEKFRF